MNCTELLSNEVERLRILEVLLDISRRLDEIDKRLSALENKCCYQFVNNTSTTIPWRFDNSRTIATNDNRGGNIS